MEDSALNKTFGFRISINARLKLSTSKTRYRRFAIRDLSNY